MDLFAHGLPFPNCRFCGSAFHAAGKTMIEEGKAHEVVHVTCLDCGRALVLATVRSATRVRSVGVLTDCNARDYARFCKGHRVTIDDVLAVHERLQR